MTRNQFIEGYNDFGDLLDVCNEYDLYSCEDLYSNESVNDYIYDDIRDLVRDQGWETAICVLENIPRGCDWYICTGWCEFREADDSDFYQMKNDILFRMDEEGLWDEDDESENSSPFEEINEDIPDEFELDSSVSLDDFFITTSDETDKILKSINAENEETKQSFESFMACVTSA